MPGDFLRAQDHAINRLRPALILLRVRFVAYPQFARGSPRPFIVAKEDHLDVRVQQHPALQRIALDDAAVASKGLPRREERQHFLVTLHNSRGSGRNERGIPYEKLASHLATDESFYSCPRRLRDSCIRSTGSATRFASY